MLSLNMNLFRILFVYFFLFSVAYADKMEEYMENCVDDFFKEVPYAEDTKEEVDAVVWECTEFLKLSKERFYYYKGKMYSKPRR